MLQRIVNELLQDFDPAYRQSNWVPMLIEMRDLSRALRDEDPERVRASVVTLVSWLFATAIYFKLDLDAGWRNWTSKVRRKSYLPKVNPPALSASSLAPTGSQSGSPLAPPKEATQAASRDPAPTRPPAGPSWRA